MGWQTLDHAFLECLAYHQRKKEKRLKRNFAKMEERGGEGRGRGKGGEEDKGEEGIQEGLWWTIASRTGAQWPVPSPIWIEPVRSKARPACLSN